jgi:hypothetical protein
MVRLKFAVLVEKDEEGYYVASVPELPGCHTQAKTWDKSKFIAKFCPVWLHVDAVIVMPSPACHPEGRAIPREVPTS